MSITVQRSYLIALAVFCAAIVFSRSAADKRSHSKRRGPGVVALIGNEVGAIFVHPRHPKTGIGRGLMDKAREHECNDM